MKNLFNQNWTEALGLTIFDSLWQGALVLAICSIVLMLMKKASPAKRYYLVLFAIISLPIISVITFNQHFEVSTAFNPIETEVGESHYQPESASFTFIVADQAEAMLQETSMISQWRLWTYKNSTFALLIWIAGVLVFTIRMLGGFYLVNNLKNNALLIENSEWMKRLLTFKSEMNIKSNVLLKESSKISSPLVLGILKPMIIFPIGLIEALPTDQIEAILVHELAHIKRKDFLINILINVLQVVYFFHPAFWWLSAQLDAEREFHCDEIALSHLGQKLSLVKALATITSLQGNRQPALAFAGKRNMVLERMKRIVDHKPQINWLSGLLSLTLLGLSFFLLSFTQPEQEDSLPNTENDKEQIETDLSINADDFLSTGSDFISENREMLSKEMMIDTSKVGKAVLEMLMPDSPIKVKNVVSKDLSILTITRNDVELEGEELLTYTQAYERIKAFSKGQSAIDQDKLERRKTEIELERLKKEVAQLKKNNEIQSKSKLQLKVDKVTEDTIPVIKGIRVRRVGADRNDEVSISDSLRVNGKVRVQINGEMQEEGFNLGEINADAISHISVIKGHKELAKLALDTTAVDGLVRITTKPNVDWKLSIKQSVREVNIRSSSIEKESKQLNENAKKDTLYIPFELDGVRFPSLENINMQMVKNISVIKADSELHAKGYDTTTVQGIIILDTNRGRQVKKNRDEKTVYLKNANSSNGNGIQLSLEFALADKTDSKLVYELDGKIVTEKQFQKAGDQIKSLDVLSNLDAIRVFYPELKGDKIKLIRASTNEAHNVDPNSIFESREYQATVLTNEYSEIIFGNVKSQAEEKKITFAKIKDKSPIIELDGVLRPDLSIQKLDYLLIKKVIIIQGDRIYDYYKKRELKGKDTLVKVFTK